MRTTITLDEDVAQTARAAMAESGKPFKQVVNDALRAGLKELKRPSSSRRYRTRPKAMRLRKGLNVDNIQELLDQVETRAGGDAG